MVKLLFLPHCLRKEYVHRIKLEGEKRCYEVYVVGGGSRVKKIMEKYDIKTIDRLVGVACGDEIKLATDYLNNLDIGRDRVFSVQLSKDGCKDTSVDLEKVLSILD